MNLLIIFIVELTAFFVVSQKLDQPKGPWRLVFKAVQGKTSGSYNNFWDLYLSVDTLNSDSVKERRDFSLVSQPFKSRILEDWALKKTNVQAVRLSFFKNNTEQQYIVFDAVGKTKNDWFSCSDILYSSYSDITTAVINRCTPSVSTQRLVIETETLDRVPDCESVAGFIIAVDKNYTGMVCKGVFLPVNSSIQPYFRYSSKGSVGNFATDLEYADSVAIFVQVWDLTLKGVSGVDGALYALWLSNDVKADDNTSAKTLTKAPSLTFKSGLVNNWSFYNIDMVKYAMFSSGLEKTYVVFDGINTNRTSWFSNDKILFSSYDDIFNTKTECSISGDGIRRWEIHNAQNVGCTDDKGWMEILDDTNATDLCSWDRDMTLIKPYFLYSSSSVAVSCEIGGNRNPDFTSAEVMGVFVHGGRLVFKVSDGGIVSPASDLYALWTGNFTLNEDDPDAYSFERGSKTLKSKIVNEWDNYYIRGVKVAFYKDGQEQAYVVFDATAADKTGWFSKKRVLYSSYTDINNSAFLVFSADGNVQKSQRFFMAESQSNCESSVGWTVVLDRNNTGSCTWERFTNGSRPAFVYLRNSKGRFADGIAADSFAVFLDMENCPASGLCENNGTCEDLSGNFRCHCVNDYYGRTCSNKDGNFSAWSSWNECPVTCGGGIQTRKRTCDNPAPIKNGVCYGQSIENKTCNTDYCPIDGGFSEWTEWSNCTEACGGGLHNRSRKCDNPLPQYGGADCVGNVNETESCNVHHCPVHGNWSEWTEWSTCTVTCSGGNQTRSRTCDNPEPQYGGANCTGGASEIQECNTETCPPVNGNWSAWSSWSQCSITCSDGGGNQTRFRMCTNPKPEWGGLNCTGEDTETQEGCNNISCPINGNWSAWSSWSQCSITCSDGGGNQTRFRNCTHPEPEWGGLNCTGVNTETQKGCNNISCPSPCINYNPKTPSQCEFEDNKGTTAWAHVRSHFVVLYLLTSWCLSECLY